MKFYAAIVIWLVMAAIIGTGLLLAVKGSPWLLLASLAGFVIAIAKIACLQH